jgi:hypothetical protein
MSHPVNSGDLGLRAVFGTRAYADMSQVRTHRGTARTIWVVAETTSHVHAVEER